MRAQLAKAQLRGVLSFPNPVNDLAARVVAGAVVAMSVVAAVLGQPWLMVALAYGFWARVLTGPTLSPLAQAATRLVAPHLGPPRPVAGPPKRFAQAMGATFSTAAVLLWFAFGEGTAARAVLGALAAAASLEAFAGYCLGCRMFGLLMRWGVVPGTVCESCADLSLRHPELRAGAPQAVHGA
ncbi:MAG: DUF4395 domain-containing protein [Acidimicrobiales bacterium]